MTKKLPALALPLLFTMFAAGCDAPDAQTDPAFRAGFPGELGEEETRAVVCEGEAEDFGVQVIEPCTVLCPVTTDPVATCSLNHAKGGLEPEVDLDAQTRLEVESCDGDPVYWDVNQQLLRGYNSRVDAPTTLAGYVCGADGIFRAE